jgi:hypothetical protein
MKRQALCSAEGMIFRRAGAYDAAAIKHALRLNHGVGPLRLTLAE